MKSIEATFKVITPMFMAGSNQNQAEFRIPSLLGALRFWYRATAPQKLQQNIHALRETEAELFGSADKGQAQFLIRVKQNDVKTIRDNKAKWCRKPGIGYLGYGPITYVKEEGGNIVRNYIQEGSTISLSFIFRSQIEDPDIEGLQRAIKALTLFGGLGSRSRRGFGSVALLSLKHGDEKEIWRSPRSREELYTAIQKFTISIGCRDIKDLPEYTAFTSSSRVILSKTIQNPINLLDSVGSQMIRYRSYGRKNKDGEHTLPGGGKAEQIFALDHDLLLDLNHNPDKHPQRIAFGLPHNYYFGSTGLKVDVNGETSDRRASPLFIHIHQLEREYTAVLTYLPAHFLPEGEAIKMIANGQTFKTACEFDSKVITDFLKRIPDAMEVL